MILAIKILLTIILVGILAFCTWFVIEEIRTYRNWYRVAYTLVGIVLAIMDILIIWM